MRKLFLWTFILTLFCTWVIGVGLASASKTPNDVTNVTKVKVKQSSMGVLYKGISQPRIAPVRNPNTPVILTPAFIADDEVITDFQKEPITGTLNVPDENVILQGGDDIGSAVAIGSLPYSNTGTTEGYTDDYDEECPSASASPDVVYSYTPSGAETVDIYVWGYDTKLFVYENSWTPGNPYACNDDFFYYGQSALQDLALTGGNTYYIVIDGWSGDFGAYEFEMLLSPTRPVGNYCADAVNQVLVSGVISTWNNNSQYALDTDEWFAGPEVFISFTLPFEMDVTLDMCGTTCEGDRWAINWLNNGIECPLTSSTTSAEEPFPAYRDVCFPDDDNITMVWYGLEAGTYYYPVFSIPEVPPDNRCAWGDFTVNVVGNGCAEDEIRIEIMTDEFGQETTWEVWDVIGNVMVGSGGPYDGPNDDEWLFIEYVCVPPGCYEFTIFDDFGDGICCDYGIGYYNVYYNDELVGTGGEFGLDETISGIGDGCIGACCVDAVCVATNTQGECNVLGGEWFIGEDCGEEFDCPAPSLGACCHTGGCDNLLQSGCIDLGGYWHPDDNCVSYTCLDVLYHEDFSSGMGDWTGGGGSWAITFDESHTPPACMTDSPGGDYGNLENNIVELATDISLTGAVGGYTLEFDTKFEIETGFDYVYLDISPDGGGTWNELHVFNGEAPEDYEWHIFSVDISGYSDQSVRFRFTLESDGAYIVDGMYVDDVYVYGLTTDLNPPLILHTGPTPETSVPEEFTAVATIVDPSGIAWASLTYTVDNGAETTIGPDDVSGDVYTFIVPQQEAGARVRYFISAEDGAGNSGSTATEHYVSGTIVMYDDNDPEFIYQYSLDDKIAIRFTPPSQATLVTAMFRLYTDVNRPIEFVDVEVWSNDSNDMPDQSLAGPIAVWAESDLGNPQGWTYVDLRGEGLDFSANEDFHTGYTHREYHPDSAQTFPVILGDSPAATDRSKTSIGGAPWGNASTDFHARVVLDLQGGGGGDCVYIVADCDHNGTPLELTDVVAMIGYYRGLAIPAYDCDCPGVSETFTPDADPNSNCTAYELSDVVAEISYYRGQSAPGSGCASCPGQGGLAPGEGGTLVIPSLKSKVKASQSGSAD